MRIGEAIKRIKSRSPPPIGACWKCHSTILIDTTKMGLNFSVRLWKGYYETLSSFIVFAQIVSVFGSCSFLHLQLSPPTAPAFTQLLASWCPAASVLTLPDSRQLPSSGSPSQSSLGFWLLTRQVST